ncbi:hypothetical protein SLEP1_g47315 [Rubroshorea leprosula]|uniref:Uncharacterized protein n=1 Tax=Rubroshorea leprosula TaxID=152421 RepID=A0AAV5LQW0_9ROSI|nr:hypothetical protein SLEP1_g47315 [Rubroshorea leprosula]
MALFANWFSCFSESKSYECQGDVCVLRHPKKAGEKTLLKRWQHRGRLSFARLSIRRTSSTL